GVTVEQPRPPDRVGLLQHPGAKTEFPAPMQRVETGEPRSDDHHIEIGVVHTAYRSGNSRLDATHCDSLYSGGDPCARRVRRMDHWNRTQTPLSSIENLNSRRTRTRRAELAPRRGPRPTPGDQRSIRPSRWYALLIWSFACCGISATC